MTEIIITSVKVDSWLSLAPLRIEVVGQVGGSSGSDSARAAACYDERTSADTVPLFRRPIAVLAVWGLERVWPCCAVVAASVAAAAAAVVGDYTGCACLLGTMDGAASASLIVVDVVLKTAAAACIPLVPVSEDLRLRPLCPSDFESLFPIRDSAPSLPPFVA